MGIKRVRNARGRYTSRSHIGLKQGAKRLTKSQGARKKFEAAQDGYFVWQSVKKG